MQKYKRRKKSKKLQYIIALICIILLTVVGLHVRIKLNEDMPYGLYRIVNPPLKVGDFVSTCLPEKVAANGVRYGFIHEGNCPGGAASVIRRVDGLGGMDVIVGLKGVVVMGAKIPLSSRMSFDQHGRSIPAIKPGTYLIKSGDVWVMGAGANKFKSWDSRYFGAIRMSLIRKIYRPLMMF